MEKLVQGSMNTINNSFYREQISDDDSDFFAPTPSNEDQLTSLFSLQENKAVETERIQAEADSEHQAQNDETEASLAQSPLGKGSGNVVPEFHELAEQIGEFVHYWGFKRVHGKMWTHLFLARRPLDAGDLVSRMKISKALVSISLRELLEYEVIQELGKSPRGTHLYKTNPDILAVILSVLRQREKRMLSRIEAAHQALVRISPDDKHRTELSEDRLGQLEGLVGRANLALESFIHLKSVDFGDWREAFSLESVQPSMAAPVQPLESNDLSAIKPDHKA